MKATQHGTGYARVMHAIGGFTGKNDNSDMLLGSEEVLKVLSPTELRGLDESGIDLQRLANLGALREASREEVEEWRRTNGIEDEEDSEGLPFNTPSGDEAALAPAAAVAPSASGPTYQGLSKGQLSEKSVPELKVIAKDEGVESYSGMDKDALLNALLALGK